MTITAAITTRHLCIFVQIKAAKKYKILKVNILFDVKIYAIASTRVSASYSRSVTKWARRRRKAAPACQVRWCHRVHISLKRRYSNNNGSVPLFGPVAHYAFVSALSRSSQWMRPGNKWAFISPLFVSEYRCLLSSFDCSELFRGHIVADSVVSAELADVHVLSVVWILIRRAALDGCECSRCSFWNLLFN